MAAPNRLLPTMGGTVEAVVLGMFMISVVGVSQETAPKPAQECRNRPENPRNRKITFFYIETILNFFFQFQKIKISDKTMEIFKIENVKILIKKIKLNIFLKSEKTDFGEENVRFSKNRKFHFLDQKFSKFSHFRF